MALDGELAKYIGNELVNFGGKELAKAGAKSTLSSLVPSSVSKAGKDIATKAGTATLGGLIPKMSTSSSSPDMMILYRGLTQKYDPNYPVAKLDTSGYESWTDNIDLARQYGDNVYSIQVPKSDIKTSYLDENPKSPTYGDRNPIYSIDKKAGLNGVSGNEYLLEVGSPYQKGLVYNEVPSEIETAVKNSGVSSGVAKRADNYLGGRMLDKNGKPITFYHSTPNEFSEFDDARLGENTGYDNTALGHFVTTDKDFSKRFIDIDNTGKTGRTMELQAKIQKPITHPYMASKKYDSEQLDKIVEDYLVATDNVEGLEMLREYADEDGTSLYDAYMDMTFGGEDPFEMAKNERELLKNKGYDAVEIVEGLKNELVDGSTDKTPVSSYAVLNGENLRGVRHIPVEQEQLRYNSVPVKFNKSSIKSLEPATKLGKDLNSVAEAMRAYKDKNVKKMADNMIDEYGNSNFDWAALRKKGEKAIEKIVGEDGLKKLKGFVEPVVNNSPTLEKYEMSKANATNFLKSAGSDKIIEASKELLPPGTKIYRRGSKDGISWTTDKALAMGSKYDGELLEHVLTKDDRYIAPQFIDILQKTIENEDQVLFKLK